MTTQKPQINDTRQVFKECMTCSRTFCHLLNRHFINQNEFEEKACDLLAGGIMNKGQQCGMLWGATIAIGKECFLRYEDFQDAMNVSVASTQSIVKSFIDKTGTVNCKEIIGIDIDKFWGLTKFILLTSIRGEDKNPCYKLAEEWTFEAIQTAEQSISNKATDLIQDPVCCASEIVKNMDGSKEERIMVSGYSGGLGLSGNACGALSATIWKKTLDWCKKNPKRRPPYFNNKIAKQVFREFSKATGSEIICEKICGKKFNSFEEHSDYIKDGGCKKLIKTLSFL